MEHFQRDFTYKLKKTRRFHHFRYFYLSIDNKNKGKKYSETIKLNMEIELYEYFGMSSVFIWEFFNVQTRGELLYKFFPIKE